MRLRIALVAALLIGAACSDDASTTDGTSSSTTAATSTTQLAAANDPALRPLLVEPSELPAGFATSGDVDNTITTFCIGEDAAAGLQASGRAFGAFKRTPPGASVVHLVFRFKDDDATRFVTQATQILGRCSDIPAGSGLAFTYEPATAALDAALAGTDSHVSSYGISVGSGAFAINLAVFRRGDLGELIAVLTKDEGRDVTDSLALAAFTAAVAKLPAS